MVGEDKLQETCLAIQSRFDALTAQEAAADDSLPDVLYHYASAEGLVGIIETGQIWATNALYLNDASELSDAIEMLTSELESTPLKVGEDPYLVAMTVSSYLQGVSLDHFVISFCEDGDLLSQWRGYGVSGSGYSVGFRASALVSSANLSANSGPGLCMFRKAKYAPAQKLEMIRKRIAILNELLESIVDEWEPRDDAEGRRRDQLLNQIATSFRSTLILMKHTAFAAEREWRLVRTLSKSETFKADWPVKVRKIRGMLAPYVPISWSRTTPLRLPSIKEVCCGPSANPELDRRAVRDLLDGGNCRRTSVIRSQIPLRV